MQMQMQTQTQTQAVKVPPSAASKLYCIDKALQTSSMIRTTGENLERGKTSGEHRERPGMASIG